MLICGKMWEFGWFMPQFFFSGSACVRLDEKGRFVLPQEMRYGLIENGSLDFTLALGLGGSLAIYKKSEIEKMVEGFREKQHVAKFQKFFTLFFSTLYPTSCDKIGRVSIPPMLRKAIRLEIQEEIVVAGVLNKIELWPKALYEENLKTVLEGNNPAFDMHKISEEVFSCLRTREDEESLHAF